MSTSHARKYDLAVVGAGPAGCAAAVHAVNLGLLPAHRIVVLDKANFPRDKICGGGIVRRADYALHRLGVKPEASTVLVHRARFIFAQRSLTIRRQNMFRTVRRLEFDQALLRNVESKGVRIEQDTRVLGVEPRSDGVEVHTARGSFFASVVIGADGAAGVMRRHVISTRPELAMIGVETITPALPDERYEYHRHMAVFDFRCRAAGVQGYSWDFPTGFEQAPLSNRGVFHSHAGGTASRVNLKTHLLNSLQGRGIPVDGPSIRGHPEHRYDPLAACSAPRILLAGDAIGVEPLLGEGISSALETGMLAAETACRALSNGDYSFSRYGADVGSSHKGRCMRLKRLAAQHFYGDSPEWWLILGTVGLGALHTRASQTWDGVTRARPGA